MADTTSPLFGLLLMETGAHEDNWGTLLNQQIVKIEDEIEDAISSECVLATTGGASTLTADQALVPIIRITGILTSAATVIVPAGRIKSWVVSNETTGAFDVFVKVAGEATGYLAQRGLSEVLWTAGATIRTVGDLGGAVPIGTVLDLAHSAVPANYLACNGALVSRTTYARLFAAIGTAFGAGDGSTTFALPNLTDRYRRGGTSVGQFLGQDIQSHGHGASASGVGDHTHGVWDAGEHVHSLYRSNQFFDDGVFEGNGQGSTDLLNNTVPAGNHSHGMSGSGAHTHTISIAAAGGAETRPNSVTFLPVIRFQ